MIRMASDDFNEIKKLQKDGDLIIGTSNTLKKLRQSKIAKVWLSSNVPLPVREEIMQFASMQHVPIISLEIPNEELGVICKKPFSISVVSVQVKGH